MNLLPMRLRLIFRIFDAAQAREKLFAGIDVAKARAESFDEQTANLLGFVLAQQAVVDENTDQPIFDRAMNQRRRHRRIDAAAERAEHAASADLVADLFDRSFDEMLHRPVRPAAADTKNKIVEDLTPARRMRDFGMKLHAEEAPGRIGEGGDGRIAAVRQARSSPWESASSCRRGSSTLASLRSCAKP